MLPKIIPDKLPGAVCAQYLRCHKPNCRCTHGELHEPYRYRFWHEDGYRLRKEYVHKADLGRVRAACAAYQQENREGRELIKLSDKLVRRMKEDDRSRSAWAPALAHSTQLPRGDFFTSKFVITPRGLTFHKREAPLEERISIKEFMKAIERLPSDEPRVDPRVWYTTQKEHWLGWLSQHNTAGAYGRIAGRNYDAKHAYNHVVNPQLLLWLIERQRQARTGSLKPRPRMMQARR